MLLSRRRITGRVLTVGATLLVASCVSNGCLAAAVADDVGALSSAQDLPALVKTRRERVQAQIERAPTNEWSAEYYEGDGLGVNTTILLDEAAGVAATWHGCMGLYGSNEGSVESKSQGRLALHYELPNGAPGEPRFGTFPEGVHKVRWGERRYLLPEERGVEFVNAMHRGFEPRDSVHGMFLLARDDENKPVTGLPDLPPSLLALVRKRPLVLKVTRIDDPQRRGSVEFPACVYRLHFELPPGETLAKGIELRKLDDEGYSVAKVVQASTATAVAEIQEYDACDMVKSQPRPGLSFSTGAYPPISQP